jgi:hypothetical protein
MCGFSLFCEKFKRGLIHESTKKKADKPHKKYMKDIFLCENICEIGPDMSGWLLFISQCSPPKKMADRQKHGASSICEAICLLEKSFLPIACEVIKCQKYLSAIHVKITSLPENWQIT